MRKLYAYEKYIGTRIHDLYVESIFRRPVGKSVEMAGNCLCVCGAYSTPALRKVIVGLVKSCGCHKVNMARVHGRAYEPEYATWRHMKTRCYCKTCPYYHRYGGRGIRVCDRWLESFQNFFEDMGPRPPGMSIDRINNNGDYEPSNCRWATLKQQMRNTRSVRIIEFQGERKILTEWAEQIGINPCALASRFTRGWSLEQALTLPKRARVWQRPSVWPGQ